MAEVKKKIRPGAIELHPEELALVVNYEVQEVLQQPDGTQEVANSSHATKKITVKSLNERTDLPALAAEVVEKCKLIHPSKVRFVQGLLQQLQQRQLQAAAGAPADNLQAQPAQQQDPHQSSSTYSSQTLQAESPARPESASSQRSSSSRPTSTSSLARPSSASVRPASAHRGSSSSTQHQGQGPGQYPAAGSSSPSRIGRQQQRAAAGEEAALVQQLQQRTLVQASEIFQDLVSSSSSSSSSSSPAFLDELDSYTEGLYDEDLAKRAAAAGMICQLFRNTAHLEALLSRETLLPTLARVLREDGVKSLELATAVAGCFLACSSLAQLHKLLLENQVGTLLMDLASLELLQRAPAREAQEGPGSSAAAIAARAAAAAARSGAALNDRERRLAGLVVRQDRFLYVAVATLLHLAEDPSVQRKMRKKDIVGLLAALLSRPHAELLLLAVGFLRRLCVFAENKDRLAAIPGMVPQLVALLAPGCGEALQTASLRLLHNLSFDGGLRQQMVQAGLVPQAVQLLDSRQAAPVAAGLLYQLSIENSAKPLFAFCSGALPRLYESIMRAMGAGAGASGQPAAAAAAAGAAAAGLGVGDSSSFAGFASVLAAAGGDLRSVPELIALAVNLAHSKHTAEWFCEGERLERLLRRSLAAADELAWKLLRNLATSGEQEVAARLLAHARGMTALLQTPSTGPELFVEALGTLAAACDALSNASSGDSSSSSLAQLLPIDELLRLLQACFMPGALEEDALLEAVVLLGALAGQPEFDEPLASCGLLARLVELIAAKKADDEFVLQVCWAFSRCLMTPLTTAALLSLPQVVPYLVDLLQDSCLAVRRVAGSCLDAIMDSNEAAAGTIRSLKFEAHNQEWLQLAGPEAHAIMAAAAAAAAGAAGPGWQQQQQHLARASVGGGAAPVRRSAATGSEDAAGPSSSSSSRATGAAVPNYTHGSSGSGGYGPTPGMGEDYQQQQLQWVTSSAGLAAAAGAGDAAVGGYQDGQYCIPGSSSELMQQQQQQQMVMQLHAGGQRMVLDLDELVGGGADSMDSMQDGGGPWNAVAVA
uniref:Uncharacterized protein n=1 Tax=Tetradesmus obliquus TaxID=3088 RepID=A0A383VI43_TETOB|eukprot:jgi/Sobl393_1/17043/SZX64871.1